MTHYLSEEAISSSDQIASAEPLTLAQDTSKRVAKPSKEEIRASLHASTLDGVYATIFSNITGGVLLSNFLVELNATPTEIGMLASIPMVANLLQPLGAHWADRTTSRRNYGTWVYGVSRILWLPLAVAIILFSYHPTHPQRMIWLTLAVLLITHVMGAMGSASWLSWLAALVPRQLRGRYFGFRNSTFSLTNLIATPILGAIISGWFGGSLQGFGVLVVVGVIAGMISLAYQHQMADVNPQAPFHATSPPIPEGPGHPISVLEDDDEDEPESAHQSLLKDSRFLVFLLYFCAWAFSINLCNPFFNVYLLDNLALNLNWVTVYNGLSAGANLLMFILWGKLADRIGNRPILILDGILVAIIPLLWLGTDTRSLTLWLWFPLLHMLGGGAGAALDLCMNNLQLAIAPVHHHTKYFAITAALGGVSGAAGVTVGGWFAEFTSIGSIPALFALSSGLRLIALLPLLWVQEPQSRSLRKTLQGIVAGATSEAH
ncbi:MULTISPECIES: MFS transporter [unclassified Leptolyngbya]|uniref:MFS transporter n=1 Tax=unclassified Leptolyngbya TaxID=2650499 RepID=UPI001684EA9E|nr:MFS transporter [Leptolyngbya sp. FACHB-8]MBD2154940.1 MFS transporter [Leptolyngbya sp. FACHB-16]